MADIDVDSSLSHGYVIVALRGELDVLDAAGVAGALAAVTAREPWVIVDLVGLEFIDASGLGALVGLTAMQTAGAKFLVVKPRN